jgi:hypothetical protein
MLKTPRARKLIALVVKHCLEDARTKYRIVMNDPRDLCDWSIWMVRPGWETFTLDHYTSRC